MIPDTKDQEKLKAVLLAEVRACPQHGPARMDKLPFVDGDNVVNYYYFFCPNCMWHSPDEGEAGEAAYQAVKLSSWTHVKAFFVRPASDVYGPGYGPGIP